MRPVLAVLPCCAFFVACSNAPVPRASPGEPWPGVRSEDVSAFQSGRDLFHQAFRAEDGLGPTFNQARCSSCHDVPTLGGAGVEQVLKGTRFEAGRCDLLQADGGDVFQLRTTPVLQAQGVAAEPVSRRATALSQMSPPPLYGLGALEAIPDESILERADPDDRNEDGISGRAGRTADGRLGRFGRKARFATLREFAADAFLREMGLTTPDLRSEESIAGQPAPAGTDPAADPEIGAAELSLVTRYLELLAFPESLQPAAARDSIDLGRRVFTRTGCASCHTPTMRTGPSRMRAISHKIVPLYSDLLLHDMGAELASVCAPGVAPSEWRTAPLFGLRLRMQFLHDGRVQTVDAAIRLHGGEAESSRTLFETLSPVEKAQLLRFLLSL
jgi:CxxC motif-containing protein (DUF1111 family)